VCSSDLEEIKKCFTLYVKFPKNRWKEIERAEKNSISHIICVGVDLESSIKCIELSEKHEMIYATVGYHPHESKEASDFYLHELEQLLKHKKVVAIGEVGLDYHHIKDVVKGDITDEMEQEIKEKQKKIFVKQFELAQE
jgi:TatD DNase family protein